jgi:peptidoglycan/LPS O-acetylase OafA/YrhL
MPPIIKHPYRPDVDGLRAIAVLAVVLFHANPKLVPGGFIGVDIFFVISGYLITGLIASGIENNTFSFTDFYTRRIKRIFPPYIVVTLFTLIVATFLLIPDDYIFYTTSLAASWGFVANIFFSMLSGGYFAQRTEEFPLLHTWSLSVEEQFYFVFPLLLIFLYRFFRNYIIPALIVFGILFLLISQLKTGQLKAYFLLTTRAHELIIGALTFFISQKIPLRSQMAANLMGSAGMALMLGSLIIINRHTAFPGINSAYPCIGTALVIYACSKENIFTPLLKSKMMVSIGLISYSLYLWHWPIFAFLRYRKIEITLVAGFAAVALAFLLSILTWKFVESPIRQNKKIQFKRAFTQIYLIPAIAFMSVGLYSYFTKGVPQRFSGEMLELISSYSFDRDLSRACSIRAEDYKKIDALNLDTNCSFGSLAQQKSQILLIGDSHANHFKPFVEEMANQANLRGVYHVQGSCSPLDLPRLKGEAALEPSACQKRNQDLLSLAGNYKYVVIASEWISNLKSPHFAADMATVVGKIRAAGAIPVIFKDNPYSEPDLSLCILHRKRGWIPAGQNCNIPYGFVLKTQGPADLIIDNVKVQHPDAVVIDPKQVMCNVSECLTYISNTALYRDADHINPKAAKLLAELYMAKLANPFLGKF